MVNSHICRITLGLVLLLSGVALSAAGIASAHPRSKPVKIISGFETSGISQRTRTTVLVQGQGEQVTISRRVRSLNANTELRGGPNDIRRNKLKNGSTGKSPEVHENGVRIINKRRSFN